MFASLTRFRPFATFAATAVLLSSCGYTPLYQPVDGNFQAAERVQIGTVESINIEKNLGQRRAAQRVSQRLRQDFPTSGPERDTLNVTLTERRWELAVQRTATVERVQLELVGTMVLTSPQGQRLFAATIVQKAPYNVVNTPYSTESGATFARLTAANNMADEITRRMVLYYRAYQGRPSPVSGAQSVSGTAVPTPPALLAPSNPNDILNLY